MLGLIAMFTHMHIFWIAGLLIALIDFPDFSTPLNRIAGSAERLANEPDKGAPRPMQVGSVQATRITAASR